MREIAVRQKGPRVVDFINEVEEELRKDKYNDLLRKYGPYLLGLIIAIVAVAGYLEWDKSVSDKKGRATSAAYVDASNLESEGNLETAFRQFMAISEKAPAGYSGLSLLRAASIKLDLGERAEAVTLFDEAAEQFDKPRHKQLAQIKAAYILANDSEYENVISRITPLAKKDAPYEYLARELLGFSSQKIGDLSKARQEFSYLSTVPGVPESIKARADQSLSLMRVDAALSDVPQDEVSEDEVLEGDDVSDTQGVSPDTDSKDTDSMDANSKKNDETATPKEDMPNE